MRSLGRNYGKSVIDLRSFMNDFITASVVWISIGAVWTYFSDRRAYNEGMIDAIVLHNRGELTYTTYTNEEGETMVEIKVGEDA